MLTRVSASCATTAPCQDTSSFDVPPWLGLVILVAGVAVVAVAVVFSRRGGRGR